MNRIEPALKGRNRGCHPRSYLPRSCEAIEAEDRILLRLFRALFPCDFPGFPGRCPRLDCFDPFGAKSQIAQHQNSRIGLVFGAERARGVGWVEQNARPTAEQEVQSSDARACAVGLASVSTHPTELSTGGSGVGWVEGLRGGPRLRLDPPYRIVDGRVRRRMGRAECEAHRNARWSCGKIRCRHRILLSRSSRVAMPGLARWASPSSRPTEPNC